MDNVVFVFWGLGWLTAFPGAVRFTEVFIYVHLIVFGTPFDGLLRAQEIKHHFRYFMHFKLLFLIRSTGLDWQKYPSLVVFYRMDIFYNDWMYNISIL